MSNHTETSKFSGSAYQAVYHELAIYLILRLAEARGSMVESITRTKDKPSSPRFHISIRHLPRPPGRWYRRRLPHNPSQEQPDPLALQRTRPLPFPRPHTNVQMLASST